jgi:hypothetical protein
VEHLWGGGPVEAIAAPLPPGISAPVEARAGA